ncbi:ferritin-like domain-containing protein [Pseudomonas sp. D1-3]|uniref:ferritin-like domain-containing protein n=1 Tax=Phytopseudomonas argentinensis TaxID=289370 RepID=UPI0008A911DA|nr:ferritin-like domain-containing protein [Pseudomonas argentinensis]
MSERQVNLGLNRTGAKMSPQDTQQQLEATRLYPADVPGDMGTYTQAREQAIGTAERIGSVPPPGSTKGMLKTALDKMLGNHPEVLLDKLGERLAFERTGVRLYEAMVAKATSAVGANPALVATLREIQAQELEHMNLVREAIETLGGDPTTMTPCADVAAVKAQGVLQVLTDPRTTLSQSLSAILTIELEDNAAWELLIELAHKGGHPLIAESFKPAFEQEEVHLATVRDLIRRDLLNQVS